MLEDVFGLSQTESNELNNEGKYSKKEINNKNTRKKESINGKLHRTFCTEDYVATKVMKSPKINIQRKR